MNRDDIIRELGWNSGQVTESDLLDRIERVVRLAEAAEREACADIASNCCEGCAEAIRARGET